MASKFRNIAPSLSSNRRTLTYRPRCGGLLSRKITGEVFGHDLKIGAGFEKLSARRIRFHFFTASFKR
jgi:hypothetical protein